MKSIWNSPKTNLDWITWKKLYNDLNKSIRDFWNSWFDKEELLNGYVFVPSIWDWWRTCNFEMNVKWNDLYLSPIENWWWDVPNDKSIKLTDFINKIKENKNKNIVLEVETNEDVIMYLNPKEINFNFDDENNCDIYT